MTKNELTRALQEVATHYGEDKSQEYDTTADTLHGITGAFKAAIMDDKAASRYNRITGESAKGGSYLIYNCDVFDAVCNIYGTKKATAADYKQQHPKSRATDDDYYFYIDKYGRARYTDSEGLWERYTHAIRTALDYADKILNGGQNAK